MRFIAYTTSDGPMIGAVDGSTVTPIATLAEFYDNPMAAANRAGVGDELELAAVSQVPPVPPTAQIFCIGLNYDAHIAETGRERPVAPNIFGRWYTTLVCDDAEIPVPSGEPGLDWEGELAVIIGTEMVDVDEHEAMAGVLGYACFNDVTARTYQQRTPQWSLGKNAKNSGPVGPVVVTADELGDPYGLALETRHNGAVVQSTTTDQMLFKIGETISYISHCLTLYPGDVIATGTPSGVGFKRDPQVFMGPGDVVEVDIEKIGVLRSRIV